MFERKTHNMNYWNKREELKEKALNHTSEMRKFNRETIESAMASKVYSHFENPRITKTENVKVVLSDTVDALIDNYDPNGIAILNFASYKNPGGRFIEGSSAQEESLCHRSNLYNILTTSFKDYYEWNRSNLNRAMYENRALYIPDVIFDEKYKADVITCAAPNFKAASRYQQVTREENDRILKDRISFLMSIIASHNVETVVLGAWGCGVFGQDPETVARMFKEELEIHGVKNAIFAIIDEPTYKIFKKVFEE